MTILIKFLGVVPMSNLSKDYAHSSGQLDHLLLELRPPLRSFITDIFNSEIGDKFKTLPASLNHHHNYPGGLFNHSTECALLAGQVALTIMSRAEAELTIVAALIHDVGKCRTFNQNGVHSELSKFISHDATTLEILAPYLNKLENEWRLGANILRHLLSTDHRQGAFPAFPGKLLIKMADQVSTAVNRRQMIFSTHPSHHYFAYDPSCKQPYLRVPRR
jgi:putative nucleotidyltransferase with HDIG domain